ncbi:MAG: hypothetical protein JST62_10710 [Bacteroidetes bacterium]|nr:hypothetical protein [Bacteroidota bacterium]
MTDKKTFSKRLEHFTLNEKEITVREDAPKGLRDFVPIAFYDLGKQPSDLLPIVCKVLKVVPEGNWTEFPNIDYEIKSHLENCDWFFVYDIIELILQKLNTKERTNFSEEINEFFIMNGIGWKINENQIETRGDEVFETAVKNVVEVLEVAKLDTAKTEIREAIIDLSRRPTPDITGAIQHSLACLECISREITGDRKLTMGKIIEKHPNIVPKPLDSAIEKIWGFASNQGRHLQEGQAPEYLEAELVVELTSAIATYLGKKYSGQNSNQSDRASDLF